MELAASTELGHLWLILTMALAIESSDLMCSFPSRSGSVAATVFPSLGSTTIMKPWNFTVEATSRMF